MTHSYVWHDSFMCVTCFVIWLCTRGASNKQKRTWLMHMRLLSTLAVCVAVRCSVCVVVRVARVEICTREWFVWFCYRGSLFFFWPHHVIPPDIRICIIDLYARGKQHGKEDEWFVFFALFYCRYRIRIIVLKMRLILLRIKTILLSTQNLSTCRDSPHNVTPLITHICNRILAHQYMWHICAFSTQAFVLSCFHLYHFSRSFWETPL